MAHTLEGFVWDFLVLKNAFLSLMGLQKCFNFFDFPLTPLLAQPHKLLQQTAPRWGGRRNQSADLVSAAIPRRKCSPNSLSWHRIWLLHWPESKPGSHLLPVSQGVHSTVGGGHENSSWRWQFITCLTKQRSPRHDWVCPAFHNKELLMCPCFYSNLGTFSFHPEWFLLASAFETHSAGGMFQHITALKAQVPLGGFRSYRIESNHFQYHWTT